MLYMNQGIKFQCDRMKIEGVITLQSFVTSTDNNNRQTEYVKNPISGAEESRSFDLINNAPPT